MFNDFEMIDVHWTYYDYIQQSYEAGLINKDWRPATMSEFIEHTYPKLVEERKQK